MKAIYTVLDSYLDTFFNDIICPIKCAAVTKIAGSCLHPPSAFPSLEIAWEFEGSG
jgi:hypothetical protein